MDDAMTCSRPRLAAGEVILWQGKPKKSAFIAGRSLPMLPIAVIWLVLDLQFIGAAFGGGESSWFLIPFFALHLLPVWAWLGSTLTAGRSWKHTAYYVTNRRIILQSGVLAVNETSLFYKDLPHVQLQVGLIDKLFGTGTVILQEDSYYGRKRRRVPGQRMVHLADPRPIYQRVQKIVMDIQTDIEYPNAYRPESNPGYRTDYRPE